MAVNSDVGLCNMAISHLGNYGSIENIETPSTTHEITFALWYDISRQAFLKMTMPNFALSRKTVALVSETPPDPFEFSYQYPSDCLKILGIGSVEDRKNDYTIEGDRIYTNVEYTSGLPIRYIKDIEDVSLMTPEFKMAFSWFLASNVVLEVTQDLSKAQMIEQMLPAKIATMAALNAQENRPIRISRSEFRSARPTGFPSRDRKR